MSVIKVFLLNFGFDSGSTTLAAHAEAAGPRRPPAPSTVRDGNHYNESWQKISIQFITKAKAFSDFT
jgi:hypothetical protein